MVTFYMKDLYEVIVIF